MTDTNREDISPEELERANGEPLPDREEMAIAPLPDPTGFFSTPVEPYDDV